MKTDMKLQILIAILIICSTSQAQIADVPPINRENYRVFEGGSQLVKLDKTTTLENLIKSLNKNWDFEFTGKAYWIGYPEFMYSIAAHKDSAVQPLLDFINASSNIHAKLGATYCLHLIGINSTVVGRFYEKFVNTKARKALLQLIYKKELSDLVFRLLSRDPWKSDLPILAFYLKYYPTNLTLINALFRYEKEKMPFRQSLSENVDTLVIFLKDSIGVHRLGCLKTIWKEKESHWTKHLGRQTIRLFFADKQGLPMTMSYFGCSSFQAQTGTCKTLNDLLQEFLRLGKEKVDVFSYCDFEDTFHHYILKNKVLVICTPDQTHSRWLNFLAKNYCPYLLLDKGLLKRK